MKNYKKKYYGLLLALLSIVLFVPYSVSAQSVYRSPLTESTFLITPSAPNKWIGANNAFNGYGNGYIHFTIAEQDYYSPPISGASLWITNGTTSWQQHCDFGDFSSYQDNPNSVAVRSVLCPVSLNSGYYVSHVILQLVDQSSNQGQQIWGAISEITFVANYDEDIKNQLVLLIQQDLGTIMANINTTMGQMNQHQIDIYNAINNRAGELYNAINGRAGELYALINGRITDIINAITSDNSSVVGAINGQSQQQHADSQAEQNAINDNTQAVNDLNDTISNDDISGNGADGFFNNFQNNDHGLSSIITAPLSFIQNLSSSTCSPISLTLPFVSETFNLPCMSTIYSANFGNLFSLYRTIIFGIVAYYICVRIYTLVKGFKDPQDDRIEVLDL